MWVEDIKRQKDDGETELEVWSKSTMCPLAVQCGKQRSDSDY